MREGGLGGGLGGGLDGAAAGVGAHFALFGRDVHCRLIAGAGPAEKPFIYLNVYDVLLPLMTPDPFSFRNHRRCSPR